MNSIFISLLPYIIGSAAVPLQIIIELLLLKSPDRGLLKAINYVAGMTVTRLLQGLVFGLVFAESVALADSSEGKNPIISTLLLVLGILLLVAAYKKWQKQTDPDDPPPKWLTMLDSATPSTAFKIGFTLPLIGVKLWVFTLSALATIAAAQLGQPSSTIAFLYFILLAEALLLLPILFRILLPTQSEIILSNLSDWLTDNQRPITITVSLIFGLLFLQSGLRGLLA
ncbi:GAP family protein [Thermocoleostomius sinensis]|jgi:threonine/homoserine/homoserine lactone efflux protein|uniref:GAP family protein n=1 Tax=Thermocoleostomius sinensis A174 TaxID=2016057 RepID=A0A9E8ZGE1_9CYAN|nr:GAP family protein [Thermocoleostomius sinensis]WAL60848.1 GAP family protein [Thermocoleostomius sinensis A174]